MLDIQHIISPRGPQRAGLSSYAVRAGDYLFVTGQMRTLPNDPTSLVEGGIEAQTTRTMENLKHILGSQELNLERVVFARVYLVNFQNSDLINKFYGSYFQADRLPARTCIGVTGLAVGASVKIDFVEAY